MPITNWQTAILSMAALLPPIFGYFSPRFCRDYNEPPKPERKKTPEELETEKIDREIERLENLKRLLREQKELERKLKETLESVEPLKSRLENIRQAIAQLSKVNSS